MRDFEIVDVEQRTNAWYAARVGILTASVAGDMLATVKKGEAASRRDLRLRLALERLTGQPYDDGGFITPEMKRGIELETAAISAYEADSGEIVQRVGLVRHTLLPIGCSPDGVIDDFAGGVEIKCPKSATHYGYLKAGVLPPEYVAQVTHTLFVTGALWWDFASFDPRFPEPLQMFRVRVMRENLNLERFEADLRAFLSEVDGEYNEMSRLLAERKAL